MTCEKPWLSFPTFLDCYPKTLNLWYIYRHLDSLGKTHVYRLPGKYMEYLRYGYKTPTQVIQFLTFWSPTVAGGHDSNHLKGSRFTIQKGHEPSQKGHQQTCQEPIFSQQKKHLPTWTTLRLANGASLSTTELNVSPESRKFATQKSGGEDFQLQAKKNNFGSVFLKELVGSGWLIHVNLFGSWLVGSFVKLVGSCWFGSLMSSYTPWN